MQVDPQVWSTAKKIHKFGTLVENFDNCG